MAQKKGSVHDPWKDLSRDDDNDQVELDEVLLRFHMEDGSAQALKKALIARGARLTRSQ